MVVIISHLHDKVVPIADNGVDNDTLGSKAYYNGSAKAVHVTGHRTWFEASLEQIFKFWAHLMLPNKGSRR